MKRFVLRLIVAVFATATMQVSVFSQTTGAIAGTITDPNGAAVPAATVQVTGEGGQKFTAVTNDSGAFRIPSVATGVYTVTVTAPNFKNRSLKM